MERPAIEAAVDKWVREIAVDPDIRVSDTGGDFKISGYYPFLLGHPAPGASEPTSGTLSHLLELRFMLTAEETPATIDPLIARLRAIALADPELAGRLDYGTRFEIGDAKPAPRSEQNPRGGPIVILHVSVREQKPGLGRRRRVANRRLG